MTRWLSSIISIVQIIIQQRLLLVILITSLATAVVFPLRSFYVVLPFFGEKLLDYSEEEAKKTAGYLKEELVTLDDGRLTLSPMADERIREAIAKFSLEKVKIFTKTGEIIYSTDSQDIGTINQHDYFHLIVARGDSFSKIVTKNQKTLEGRIASRDVAEIYVPIMADSDFLGAFELYYDLTLRKKELDSLLQRETLWGIFVSCLMLAIVFIVLAKASRASLEQRAAEQELRRLNMTLKELVAEKTQEVAVTQEASIQSLAVLAEYYDQQTGEHINRIRQITLLLTQLLTADSHYSAYLRQRDTYVEELALASILHDIGKTSVPKEILIKPAKLTDEEFEQVKKHTVVAGDVLSAANQLFVDQFGKDSYLALAADVATYHHERWDGAGYPTGKAGQDIPLSARIVAIADVYDALCSDRPYKKAWSHEQAVELIISEAGKHFDPEIVRVFSLHIDKFREVSELRTPPQSWGQKRKVVKQPAAD